MKTLSFTILFMILLPQAYSFELARGEISSKGVQIIIETLEEGPSSIRAGEGSASDHSLSCKNMAHCVNRMMDIKISVLAMQDKSIPPDHYSLEFFDARMPEHNHGMVVSPKITKIDNYHWKIAGVKLHMKGLWQLQLKLSVGKDEEKLNLNLHV